MYNAHQIASFVLEGRRVPLYLLHDHIALGHCSLRWFTDNGPVPGLPPFFSIRTAVFAAMHFWGKDCWDLRWVNPVLFTMY